MHYELVFYILLFLTSRFFFGEKNPQSVCLIQIIYVVQLFIYYVILTLINVSWNFWSEEI